MTISRIHKAFNGAVRLFERTLRTISEESYLKIATALVNELDLTYSVPTRKAPIRIKCLSETARIRAREMLNREPDTLAWIESFKPDEVLWDIGSNIGVFSLYAAVVGSARVVAADPFPKNYVAISENLAINGLTGRVKPFCVALSDDTRVSDLYIISESDTPGGAGNPVGDNLDNLNQPVDAIRTHPALVYSVDNFLESFDLPFPNHIKVDIDGKEDRLIAGARRTLRDSRLRSLMIELSPHNAPGNREANAFILRELESAGFRFVKRVGATPNVTDDPETSVTNNFFAKPK